MCPYFCPMLWDWINLPCVLMVSRHLSVKQHSVLWESTLNLHRGQWPILQAHTKPGWIHASLFNSPWPHFQESGPVLFIGAPGTILFGSAGNIQGAREGKGTFVESCWNDSLGLWCPELCQSTFSLLPQTEITFCCSVWLLNRHGEQFWIGWTLFGCCGRVFLFLGGRQPFM